MTFHSNARRGVPLASLLSFNTVKREGSKSPVVCENEKMFRDSPILVFGRPRDASAGKLPILDGRDYGSVGPSAESPRPVTEPSRPAC
jgi:hypothetical protein